MKVLYVEDAQSDADLTRRELNRAAPDIELKIVGSVAEAMVMLDALQAALPRGEEPRFDLVLLDLSLPDGSGLDVLAEVRHRSLPLAVVVLTGVGDEHTVVGALRAGADDYVPKRNQYWTVVPPTLRSALERFRSQAALHARPLRLLYAEPNEHDAVLTRVHLATHAPFIRLSLVHSADEVLERLPKAGPATEVDVILLDYRLPGMNALDALKEIFHERKLDVPVILTTGRGHEDVALEALKLGASDYIVKSSGYLNHLAAAVENAFHRLLAARERAALRGSEARFRAFQDASPASTRIVDADGRITWANRSSLATLRLPAEQVIGKTLFEVFPEQYARELFTANERVLRTGEVDQTEDTVPLADGNVHTLSVFRFPIDNGQGGRSVGSIAIDVTERKRAEQRLLESEAKYRELIEQASDGIFVCDRTGRVLLANTRWCELVGYTQAEVTGIDSGQTYLDEERDIFHRRLEQASTGQTLRYERIVRRKDGNIFPAEFSLKMLASGMVQVIVRDITERRSHERKISRLSRIHEVLSGINSAIVRIRDRRELFQEACRIIVEHGRFTLGWIGVLDHATGRLLAVAHAGVSGDSDAVGGSPLFNRDAGLVPAGAAKVALDERRSAIDNAIEDAPGAVDTGSTPDTLKVRRAAIALGAKSVIVLPLYVDQQIFGTLTLYAAERDFFDDEELKLLAELAGDISFGLEFIAKEEKVDYLAYYDALTGLPNRSLFFDRLTHQLGAAAREEANVALLLIDLDRFRFVNDSLGRQAGDALINAVAQRIKDTFRAQDTVARVGADSFAVAVSGAWQTLDAGRALEAHNRRLFGQPFVLGNEELRVSATAGVAVFPGDGDNPEVLFANAEAALRAAKAQNVRFLFYGPEMNARIADSLRLENRLRLALENGEMVLWYQPKFSVKTRKLTGFEALMRWQDPETGLVPPGKFIRLMEQTGLILEAGRWALGEVARDCGTWRAAGVKPPRIAVNVSPMQLREKDFVSVVTEAARNMRAAGGALDIEITESVFLDSVDTIIPILQTVRALGIEIAVDDFGTGYSSLAYIARLPIHALKIDRSFTFGMTENEDSLAIVRSIISLAHTLRLNVVAEGVETEEQATLLRGLNCDEIQGFLLSRPVPSAEIPGLIGRFAT
jgi:diguanylate cyclase (GGDEF)-like protein/PAS domain S-box-containing protein